jgi:hypothetical protein
MASLVVLFETHPADPRPRTREWDTNNVFHVTPNVAR